jgi:hypothetical protein
METERRTPCDWHRAFGLTMTDLFTDSPFVVQLEHDVSIQQQFLDLVVVRRGPGRFAGRLPDGLTGLVAHNLITFKSQHEALDAWAMKELAAHHVAYRKLVSPSPSKLLPEGQFRLFAICARRPRKLPRQVPWKRRQPGVYHCRWGTDTIRVLVANELSHQPQNAGLHLFGAAADVVAFGRGTYRPRSGLMSALLDQLLGWYREEGLIVPYTMQDFARDYMKEHLPELPREQREDVLRSLPAEERLAGIPAEERLAGIPAEERLAGIPAEERLAGIPAEERLAGIPAEERLAGLSVEQIRRYLDQVTAEQKVRSRPPRRKK